MSFSSLAPLRRLSQYLDQPDSVYPLQRQGISLGVISGLVLGVLTLSPLAGFGAFVLFASVGLLWRRDEPPVLAYCVAYQWVFVAVGYYYFLFTSTYPFQALPLGDLGGATLLSLLGFLAIALGLRVGIRLAKAQRVVRRMQDCQSEPKYDIRLLFWGVIFIFAVNWVFEIAPKEMAFNQAQLISTVLSTRDVVLCLLFLSAFQQRTGYRYAIAAGVFVLLPQSISAHSAFSWIFIFLGMALLKEWRPWSVLKSQRRRNRRILLASLGIAAVLFFLALVWQGGVKENWRATLKQDNQLASPIDKLAALADIVENVYTNLDWGEATESLATRLSGTFYFSHALIHVPAVVPYEDGALTLRAVQHTLMPRFLFTDKANLGSNSWLIWQYTGMPAAGEESGTSIGLTYMAEFYIDYGRYLMFIALFIWGLLLGLIYGIVFAISPSRILACATAMALFPQPFSSFEGEIAYLLGGLVQTALVFGILLHFLGPKLHRKLLHVDREPVNLRRTVPLAD